MLPGRLSDARPSCSVLIAPGGRTLGARCPGHLVVAGTMLLVCVQGTAPGGGTQGSSRPGTIHATRTGEPDSRADALSDAILNFRTPGSGS